MFKKGEFILYGTVGVCQVEKISRTDFSDNDRLYYYLVPRYEKDTTICIPVDSDKVMMRGIMSRKDAERFVKAWPDVECKEYANDRERPQAYKEAIQSGDCLELASMIKEISRMEQSRKGKGRILSVREKDGAKAARRLLFGELAAALDIYPEDVPEYIEGHTGLPCQ
ncbi:hypothetical protein MCJ35_14955 [Enterocloster sp. OA13]|uniref:CarD family transcriptional regulator n=1 Tax=Enterocloster hominis (ex Hitch et al. 2024) TaxID=1917870 RepID=A0ABV1DC17_9FIRM|nr:CarD-like protein [Clostridiales bacterium 1_7_47FAA]MCH1950504.1 hypothetical protein [Enterocloster sp. OA13]